MLRSLLQLTRWILWVGAAALAVRAADVAPAGLKDAAVLKDKKVSVIVIPVRDEIDDPIRFILRRGLKEGADVVVLNMDTLGGNAGTALGMMEDLVKFRGTTITYVDEKAISAGAFIASATQEIWFSPYGKIGAAAPVQGNGQDIPETMKDKMLSFLRVSVRSVSEGKGYRGQVISAMIDKNFELKIGDTVIREKGGELLSLTAKEAVKTYGEPPQALLGAGIATSIDDLLTQKFGAGNFEVKTFQVTWSEVLAQYLKKLSPILLGLGLLALFIEFKTPGFGFFGISGIVLLAIVFLGNYVAGLSGHEPILFFAIGLILMVVELVFFPGVVVVALLGLVLMLGSLIWSMADLWPNQPVAITGDAFVQPLINVGLGMVVAVVLAALLLRFMPKGWFWDRMVLSTAVAGSAQSVGGAPGKTATVNSLVGKHGVAVTGLFPSGQVEIDGQRHEARVQVGALASGTAIVVVSQSDFGLVVERAEA